MDLTDAHVLVTGASRGIGAGLAREFRAKGARVTLAARSAGPLQELATELKGSRSSPTSPTPTTGGP